MDAVEAPPNRAEPSKHSLAVMLVMGADWLAASKLEATECWVLLGGLSSC